MQKGVRGAGANLPDNPERLGVPARPFLYTIDQIAVLLSVDELQVRKNYMYYEGRSTGIRHRHLLSGRNIAPPAEKPEWRVAERELLRWMKYKGFKVYETGVAVH